MRPRNSAARRVSALDLAGPRPGEREDQWVELGQDAMGQPIAAPVALLRGRREGPVVGLTAALHGDELNGIALLHALLSRIDPGRLRGSLVAVLVSNPPGYLSGTRRYPDQNDLNHLMPGAPEGKEAEVFAHRLAERIVASFDLLFDLHTASLDRINSYYVRADLSRPETAALAWRQRPQILLHAPATPSTLRGLVDNAGKPALTLEIGDPRSWQRVPVEAATAGLLANLAALGMLEREDPPVAEARSVLAARPEPLVCSHSAWIRSLRGGLVQVLPELGQQVDSGELVAELCDVFGHPLDQLVAPEAGVVIGRAISPALRFGGRVLHLGTLAGPGDLPLIESLGRARPDAGRAQAGA